VNEPALSRPAGCTWPIVLGIDPGTRVLGYGLVVVSPSGPRMLAAGVLRARKRTIAERLGFLSVEIDELLARFRPECMAVESAFSARNVRSALRLGEGRGVVLACGARFGIEVLEYPPAVVKKSVVGNGAASKEQVAAMVGTTLGVAELDVALDATDALAVALTHVFRARAPGAAAARTPRPADLRRRRAELDRTSWDSQTDVGTISQ
jgi:crossover junction endodeoxyribonuclease RuvC